MASAQENAANVRKGYEYFNTGNMEELVKLFDPGVTWHVPGRSRLAGEKRGVETVLGFFGELVQETNGTFHVELHDVVANEQHAVGLHTNKATRNGKQLNMHVALVFHINAAGKVDEIWDHYEDTGAVDEFFA